MVYKLNDTIDFGRYKGFTIEEVYKGWGYPTQDFVADFIRYCFDNLCLFRFYFLNKEIDLRVAEFEFLIDNKMRIISKNLKGALPKNYLDDLNIALKATEFYPERSYFGSANDFIIKRRKDQNKPYKIFGDPDYILWCISTMNKFCLSNEEINLLGSYEINVFNGVSLKHVQNDLYSYTVQFGKVRRVVTEELKATNQKKFDQTIQTKHKYIEPDPDDYSYDRHENAYGYDDDTIDGAFEGDPENYWNVD